MVPCLLEGMPLVKNYEAEIAGWVRENSLTTSTVNFGVLERAGIPHRAAILPKFDPECQTLQEYS